MPVPFTFIFNVPGIVNPFSPNDPEQFVSASSRDRKWAPVRSYPHTIPCSQKINGTLPPSLVEPTASLPPTSTALASRKRGWYPTFAEPSRSTTTLTSTTGYLNPPARTRDYFMNSAVNLNAHVTSNEADQGDEANQDDPFQEMPPLKKRRGLAGTIISTAVNAALIGTAVGLTVYRLWRNRGKLPEIERPVEVAPESPLETLPPPPPYEGPSDHYLNFDTPKSVHVIPPSPQPSPKKSQHQRQTKRPTTHHRRQKSHRTHAGHYHLHHHFTPSSSDLHTQHFSTRTEHDSERESHVDEVEDKMDWIGDKLSMLIEQGKRALNTEVVVSSDAVEDAVDDGSEAWEEENVNTTRFRSCSGSVRHSKRPKTLNNFGASAQYIDYTSSSSLSSSPRFGDITPCLPTSHSTTSLNYISVEDSSAFESPELRESMERARQRLLTRRLGGGT